MNTTDNKMAVHFSSNTDLLATPQKFFEMLDAEFNFTLDPCCNEENKKCEKYYTLETDGLSQNWDNELKKCDMKTYRLQNDLKWNYGIRIQRDYATFTGKRIDIFCFKMDELPELGAMFQIKKGFWFSFAFAFNIRIERWYNWDLTTNKGRKYKKLTQIK